MESKIIEHPSDNNIDDLIKIIETFNIDKSIGKIKLREFQEYLEKIYDNTSKEYSIKLENLSRIYTAFLSKLTALIYEASNLIENPNTSKDDFEDIKSIFSGLKMLQTKDDIIKIEKGVLFFFEYFWRKKIRMCNDR